MILLIPILEFPILPFLVIAFVCLQFLDISIYNYLAAFFISILPFLTTYSIGCLIDSVSSNAKVFSKYLGLASFLIFYTYNDSLLIIIELLQKFSFLELMKLISQSIKITALCALVLMLINLTIEIPLRLVQKASSLTIKFSYPAIRVLLFTLLFSVGFELFTNFLLELFNV